MNNFKWIVGIVVGCALLSPGIASAKRGIVLITRGETITPLGTASVKGPNPNGVVSVGYKYEYFGVFWVDFWTWDGTHCVYEGDRYAPITAAQAAEFMGVPESSMSPPIMYRIPLGWMIIGGLLLAWVAYLFLKKRASPAESTHSYGEPSPPAINDAPNGV